MQTLADDNDLIRASQNGDMASLEILLDRHHDRIRAVCAKVVGRGADADDAAQMALISIVKNLEKFDGRAQFSTWSYRIATNAAIDELRRRNRRTADSIDDDERHVQVAALGNMSEAASARIVVNDALEQLAEEFRLPVILRDLCGLDYDQIAEVLELAPGTVRSRIARGRGKLADIIGSVSGDDVDDVIDDGNQFDARGVQGHDDE
jgi:RNA polymerase sigma-70 factor (ECF subfamily)